MPDKHHQPRSTGEPHDPEEQSYIPQPEDFLPSPKRPLSAFEKMPPQGSLLPGAVFVALMTAFSILSWVYPDRFGNLGVTKSSILADRHYIRLLTALFVHGDMQHLLRNWPIFLFFSWLLQGYFGVIASIVLPLLIGIISNAVTVYFYEDQVRLLGASGMIYGMVALWLVFYVNFDRGNWWVKRVLRAVGFSLLVMFPQTYDPNVSYLAHFSGFVCGLLIGTLSIPLIRSMAPVDLEPPSADQMSGNDHGGM